MKPDGQLTQYFFIQCVYSGVLKPFLKIPNSFRETAIFQNAVWWKYCVFEPYLVLFHEKSFWKITVSLKLLGFFKHGLRTPE